jgi:putative phosphoribosyl transferase
MSIRSDIDLRQVQIPPHRLGATVQSPARPVGLILFAHGSGSSRFSPRNASVAAALNDAGFVTVLLDLLTPEEGDNRRNIFDISLLASRLIDAIAWIDDDPELAKLPLGLFGASTGAAGALVAASRLGDRVGAVVSRGGRPDLAGPTLKHVRAPTLLIVGGRDDLVIELNQQALTELPEPKALCVVPGATHLFSERGALETVSTLATEWFSLHLCHTAGAMTKEYLH